MVMITATTLPMNIACTHARSPLSANPNRKANTIAEMKNSAIQSGTGISPAAPWMRSWRACLPVGGLVQPLAVRRLLVRAMLSSTLRTVRNMRHAPRVDLLAEGAVLHLVPLAVPMTERA